MHVRARFRLRQLAGQSLHVGPGTRACQDVRRAGALMASPLRGNPPTRGVRGRLGLVHGLSGVHCHPRRRVCAEDAGRPPALAGPVLDRCAGHSHRTAQGRGRFDRLYPDALHRRQLRPHQLRHRPPFRHRGRISGHQPPGPGLQCCGDRRRDPFPHREGGRFQIGGTGLRRLSRSLSHGRDSGG